jgi:hypothetical protein
MRWKLRAPKRSYFSSADRVKRGAGAFHVPIVVAAADADRAHDVAFQHDRKATAEDRASAYTVCNRFVW